MSKHCETSSVQCTSNCLRAFQRYQECNKRHWGLGDLNVINKQTRQIGDDHSWVTFDVVVETGIQMLDTNLT